MDKKESPFLSIIIPTKDREAILSETLSRLYEALEKMNFEVIVVNDTTADLNLVGLNVRVSRNPGQGVASARNHGASLASGEFFIFLDDDMLVNLDLSVAIENWSANFPDACINANWVYPEVLQQDIATGKFGRFLNHYGFTTLKGWHQDHVWDPDKIFEVKSVTSQFLWMNRRIFQKIGGYNDQFPFAGFEDYDLAKYLNHNNIKIFIDPTVLIEHNERDRATDIKAWMARKLRGGKTRRVAVSLGYNELTLEYGWMKAMIYEKVNHNKSFFFGILKLIPNLKLFDSASFSLINLLYGASVYEGYSENHT